MEGAPFLIHCHHLEMSVPYRQDMPPPGGFASVRYQRNIPARGPTAVVLLAGILSLTTYGIYKVGQGNLEKRELQREKIWSRIHIIPLLLAEEDRAAYRRRQTALVTEAIIMKDVPGWKPGISVHHEVK